LPEDWEHGGFGLYLHWPFCQAKCPYCDFNSHVVDQIDQKRWEKAYLSEIARAGKETQGRILDTVFFGGGTPSMMEPALVDAIISAIRKTWRTSNSFEVTLEANPTSVEAGRFADYRDAGVNRVSLGVQALNDADLKALGRLHSAAEARAAFDVARHAFDRVSFDLIYARQDQSLAAWEGELKEALSMAVDHLSLYQLTIEDGTAFGDRFASGRLRGLPNEDLGADLYLRTQDICEATGFPGYEVSNHARPGEESRHNLIYWRYGDYVGIGPGAHGRLTLDGTRYETVAPDGPMAWLQQVEKTGAGELPRTVLSPEDTVTESLLMGLRLREGVALSRYKNHDFKNKINGLRDLGLVDIADDHLFVTAQGRPVLNSVLRSLLAD
jgi:oxygen-independent coproporphyrinogen-3 oxidase